MEQNEGRETGFPGEDGPPRREPVFNVPSSVLLLLLAFVLVHLYRGALSEARDIELLIHTAFIPARYLSGLWESGWPGFLSPFTYNFLHGDLTHLMLNGIWLLAMGSAVAKRLGSLRFLLFSAICGLFAAMAHLLTHYGEAIPVIGASGAVSGHMAAAIRFVFSVERGSRFMDLQGDRLKALPLKPLAAVLRDPRVIAVLAIFLLTNVMTGVGVVPLLDTEEASIAWEAHIGGFVAGLLLFSLFDPPSNGQGHPEGPDDLDGWDKRFDADAPPEDAPPEDAPPEDAGERNQNSRSS